MTTQSDIKKLAEHMAGSMRSSDTVLISKHQTHNLGLDDKILSSIDTALRLMLRTMSPRHLLILAHMQKVRLPQRLSLPSNIVVQRL